MSTSNTLTKNDLKKVLEKLSVGSGGVIDADDMTQAEIDNFLEDINAQGRPSEYKRLLWTNSSPSVNFAAQTLSIDLTDYDDIEVTICDYSTDAARINRVTTEFCPKGKTTFVVTPYWTTSLSSFSGRAFTPSNTGIVIGEGMNQSGVNNGNGVPLVIYGIKYEKVAPIQVDASDYVIEQGTDGIWTYRKWESGIAECWSRWVSSQAMTTAEGSCYYSTLTSLNFPTGLFTDIPVVSFGTANGGGLGNYSLNSINASSFNGYWWATMSSTRTCTANIHAIGRWK